MRTTTALPRWIIIGSLQIAHLLPGSWEDGPPHETVRAACGASFTRTNLIHAVRHVPADHNAVLDCYSCSTPEEKS